MNSNRFLKGYFQIHKEAIKLIFMETWNWGVGVAKDHGENIRMCVWLLDSGSGSKQQCDLEVNHLISLAPRFPIWKIRWLDFNFSGPNIPNLPWDYKKPKINNMRLYKA